MKVNFNVSAKDYKGEPLTKKVENKSKDGKITLEYIPVILKDLLSEPLYFGRGLESTGNQEKDDSNKFLAVKLSCKIYQSSGETYISTEEASLIKSVARECFTAGLFVQICELLGEGGGNVCE